MGTLLINVADRADAHAPENEGKAVPGLGVIRPKTAAILGATRFLGDPDSGPWVYYLNKPAGTTVPLHKHNANRVEFVIDGRVRWHEPGVDDLEYGAGTMSYVTAGTVYGYDVLEDATILIVFEEPPGVNFI